LIAAVAVALAAQVALPLLHRLFWSQHDLLLVGLGRLLALALPLVVLMQLCAEATKATMEFAWQVGIVQVLFPLLTLLFAFALHRGAGLGIASLAWGILLALVVATSVAVYAFSRLFSPARTLRAGAALRWDSEVLVFALPQSINMLMNLGLTKVDGLMLSAFVSADAVGVYVLVSDLAQLIRLGKMAFSSVFSPLVARYQAASNRRGIEEALATLIPITATLGILLTLGVMGNYEAVILHEGEQWSGGRLYPWLLCVGPLMSCFFGLAGSLLLMTGHSRLLLYNSVVAVLLNLALAALLIPRFGLLGAAVATAVSNLAISAAQLAEMHLIERYQVPLRSLARTLAAAALPSAGVVVAYSGSASNLLSRMPGGSAVIQRAAWVGLMVGAYALLIFLLPGTNPLRALFRRGLPAVVEPRNAA
jgi:O-antigen/teichoic acid export membrane protein